MKTKNPGSNHKKIIIDTEMTRLENLLNCYNISAVPHQQIERTVESLRQYVPKKQSLWNRQAERLADVLSTARQDAPFFSWGYWLAGIVLFSVGYWIITAADSHVYAIMLLIAPIPFILGLLELFKGRDTGMTEMEMSCKLSLREVILARVVVIGAYGVLLNTLLSVFIYYSQPGAYLWQLTLIWLTPFTFISAIALYIAQKVKSGYAVAFFLVTWTAAIILVQMAGFMVFLQTVNTWAHLLITFFSVIVLIYETCKMTDKYLLTTERWSHCESGS
ncbi:MAG: hypothetical protein M1571_00610 [Firmicutes bacterium]|nr:hypothetical protein [Bacillota bacterium]